MNKTYPGIHRLVFKRAGQLLLIPYKADNTLDYAHAFDSRRGIVQSISRGFSKTTVDLTDGNSDYPAHTYVTTQQGTLGVTFGTYDPELESMLSGATYSQPETKETWSQISFEVDSTTPEMTFTEDMKPKYPDTAFIIEDEEGTKLVKGSGAEALEAGQYYYDSESGKLTLQDDYKGKTIRVSYIYDAKTPINVAYSEAPAIPTYQAIIIGPVISYEETITYNSVITIDRCSVSGDLNDPERSNDPTAGWSIELSINKPREGHSPVDITYVEPGQVVQGIAYSAFSTGPVMAVPMAASTASKKR